ncbi:MAG: hypothetical protein ACJAYC_002676 [Halieaceae bacterium]
MKTYPMSRSDTLDHPDKAYLEYTDKKRYRLDIITDHPAIRDKEHFRPLAD